MEYLPCEINLRDETLMKINRNLTRINRNAPQPKPRKSTLGALEQKQLENELDMLYFSKIPNGVFGFNCVQDIYLADGKTTPKRRYELVYPISKPKSYYLLLAYAIFKENFTIDGYCPYEIAITLSKGGVMENEINIRITRENLFSSSILKFANIVDFLDLNISLFVLWTEVSSPKKHKRKAISGKTRQNVLMRDNYTCQICGATVKDGVKLEIDHIKPVSKGGTNDENNLQVLCSQCNREKHNREDLLHDKRKLAELEGK